MVDSKLKVFLCHSSNDKPIVRELYQKLNTEGWIDVWLDEKKLLPGQVWETEIEKAVEAADAIIVCLSNNSVSKEGYVQRELRFALGIALTKPEGVIYIVPLRLDDCQPPRQLREWQYLDMFPFEAFESAYIRLLESLQIRAKTLKSIDNSTLTKGDDIEVLKSNPTVISSLEQSKKTPNGQPVYVLGNIDFVLVPSGKFLMGSKADYPVPNDEKSQHEVDIPYEYLIGRFPITNRQYADIVPNFQIPEGKGNHPIVKINSEKAEKYLNQLNRKFSSSLPNGYIYRLPTEAEWEKAARGTDGREYPWGNVFDARRCNAAISTLETVIRAFGRFTTPVDRFSPQGDSSYGVADMIGNVSELTHSSLVAYPYNVNDGREKLPGNRVVRGGNYQGFGARCATREKYSSTNEFFIGFRIAVAPPIK